MSSYRILINMGTYLSIFCTKPDLCSPYQNFLKITLTDRIVYDIITLDRTLSDRVLPDIVVTIRHSCYYQTNLLLPDIVVTI